MGAYGCLPNDLCVVTLEAYEGSKLKENYLNNRNKGQKQSFGDALQNRWSKKLCKFHRKTPVMESLFNKVASNLGVKKPFFTKINPCSWHDKLEEYSKDKLFYVLYFLDCLYMSPSFLLKKSHFAILLIEIQFIAVGVT